MSRRNLITALACLLLLAFTSLAGCVVAAPPHGAYRHHGGYHHPGYHPRWHHGSPARWHHGHWR